MAKPYRKFRSVHKFGKKRKKTSGKRDHGLVSSEVIPAQDSVAAERDSSVEMPISALVSAAASDDIGDRQRGSTIDTTFLTSTDCARKRKRTEAQDDVAVERDSSVEMPISAPVSAAASDGVGDRQRATRIDTKFLTSADRAQQRKETEDKISSLSSTSASERKMRTLATAREDSDPSAASAATYVIVDLSAINRLLERTNCRTCRGAVSIKNGARDYGIAVKLCLECSNCGTVASEWSSRRTPGAAKCTPFEVNILAARAMQSTGNGQAALNDVFSIMGISHRGLHHKSYQSHLKNKLNPAATRAAEKVLSDCAMAVQKLYRELYFDSPGNVAICYDGTWMTRGHLSHIGVGVVTELFSGYVLDFVVLSNFCAGCQRAPPKEDPNYIVWESMHTCQKNTQCKSGRMEVEAAVTLFERSISRHGLRYTVMLCDGDSRSFHAVEEARVYGFIQVQKEDCINHVQKRMGTALRNLVHKHKGSGDTLSGRGRLTGDVIEKLSRYYGWALKSNVGDVNAMHRAAMATYYHVTSTDERSNHTLCPSGSDSWCKQNAAAARGEPLPRHSYNFPQNVREALLPVYERLSDMELLKRCQRGKTQNANEALHSVIWSLMPKDKHASLIAVETAVAEAVMRFNSGVKEASTRILGELQLEQNSKGRRRAEEKDSRRIMSAERKRAASARFLQQAKQRQRQKCDADYSPGAF